MLPAILTAQAFHFSIALSPDGTRTIRIIASLLSLVMTFLSLHLMVKHRQAEVADSQWLEAYEEEFPAPVGAPKWPMHGRSWADHRNSINPNIGRLGGLSKLTGFRIWSWGLSAFSDGSDRRSAIGHFRVACNQRARVSTPLEIEWNLSLQRVEHSFAH
jgi:hypothetical protein